MILVYKQGSFVYKQKILVYQQENAGIKQNIEVYPQGFGNNNLVIRRNTPYLNCLFLRYGRFWGGIPHFGSLENVSRILVSPQTQVVV